MKGRQILIEPLPGGGHAAALVVDGRLQDLLVDPDPADPTPRPEAIHRAIAARPMKGMGGVMLDLGAGCTGYLRSPRPPAAGSALLVQVSGWAEPGKAPPVAERLLLKGRTAILTPGAPGANIARGLRDPDRRADLAALAEAAMAGAPEDLGLILRSAAETAPDAAIRAEIVTLRAAFERIRAGRETGCLWPAPGAAAEALRDWRAEGDAVTEAPGALTGQLWEDLTGLLQPRVSLGSGSMAIEPTRALTAVDVDTGGDQSPAAALKVNLAVARELPRQLRLRGLGGQVVVDLAPLAKSDRAKVETALVAALRGDGIDTTLAGWTPLGHLELLRKRARRPLAFAAPRLDLGQPHV